jgi:hypothetical protein
MLVRKQLQEKEEPELELLCCQREEIAVYTDKKEDKSILINKEFRLQSHI